MASLLRSRKFWLAVAAVAVLVAVNVFGVGEETATAWADKIVEIVIFLICAIAVEDAATKLKGKKVGK